jgi:hypothetical protein
MLTFLLNVVIDMTVEIGYDCQDCPRLPPSRSVEANADKTSIYNIAQRFKWPSYGQFCGIQKQDTI